MKSNITLTPIPTAFVFADQPLDWSIKLWGEGKEEFSADDWRKFYKNAMSSNYSSWNSSGVDQEHLFMAIREEDGKSEVVASIAIEYGITKIYLWTEGQREFYGKRGYVLLRQLSKQSRVIDLMVKKLIID
jgi:hypothetical protein